MVATPLKNDGVKVSWDYDIPNWMEKNVPSHQPAKKWMVSLRWLALESTWGGRRMIFDHLRIQRKGWSDHLPNGPTATFGGSLGWRVHEANAAFHAAAVQWASLGHSFSPACVHILRILFAGRCPLFRSAVKKSYSKDWVGNSTGNSGFTILKSTGVTIQLSLQFVENPDQLPGSRIFYR